MIKNIRKKWNKPKIFTLKSIELQQIISVSACSGYVIPCIGFAR